MVKGAVEPLEFRVTMPGDERLPVIMTPSAPGEAHVIGREPTATLRLDDARVSRRHAALERSGAGWNVVDLGSRSGTFLDGRRLGVDERAELRSGSVLSIGPFDMLCSGGAPAGGGAGAAGAAGTAVAAGAVRVGAGGRSAHRERVDPVMPMRQHEQNSIVQSIPRAELGSLASRRLEVLLDLAGQLHRASELGDALDRVADALLAGTQYGRALLLNDTPAGAERLAVRAMHPSARAAPVSSTLLAAARSTRGPVRLEDRGDVRAAASIMMSGVSSALCIPIVAATDDPLSRQVVAYLDSSSGTRPPAADAAAFAHAACGLAALAIEADDRRELQSDVEAMRQVQLQMMPPEDIDFGALRAVMRCIPGRGAAGDVVGVCRKSGDGAVLVVGDVSGKGPAAAMLMASVVSHLDASLSLGTDLADAVARVNAHVLERFQGRRFVTAVLVHAAPDGRVRVIDAGHGMIVRVRGVGQAEAVDVVGGLPLGVSAELGYESQALELAPGDRLVVMTDGVTEQRSASGQMFQMEGALRALEGSGSGLADTERVIAALRAHAGQAEFDDDVTIVSVQRA